MNNKTTESATGTIPETAPGRGGVAARMDRLVELLKYSKYIHKGRHDNE